MPKNGKEHAYGPYYNADRGTWRVVIVRADGARASQTFESKARAEQVIAAVRDATETRTLSDAVSDYLESLRAKGCKRTGLETTRIRLEGILRLREGDRLLRSCTPRVIGRLYAARCQEVKPATHRGELACVVRLFEHCRHRGWMATNPAEDVEPVGLVNRGKPQLRVDEARRLLAVLAADSSPEATAVMCCLLMGLRAREVTERIGRDVDNGGRLLWVTGAKTLAGNRQVAIPSALRGRLTELKRADDERLFSFNRWQLWHVTQRYCEQAGVPRVTPHGLRGTFATLAMTGGLAEVARVMSPQALAPQFGHNDDGATMRRHYLAPGAEETAKVQQLETVLCQTNDATPEEIDDGLN